MLFHRFLPSLFFPHLFLYHFYRPSSVPPHIFHTCSISPVPLSWSTFHVPNLLFLILLFRLSSSTSPVPLLLTSPVSSLLFPLSCFVFPVFSLLFDPFCFISPASPLLFQISCPICLIQALLSHLCWFLSHLSVSNFTSSSSLSLPLLSHPPWALSH